MNEAPYRVFTATGHRAHRTTGNGLTLCNYRVDETRTETPKLRMAAMCYRCEKGEKQNVLV